MWFSHCSGETDPRLHLSLTGHHPAAPLLPTNGVTDWKVHPLPRALCPPPLRGAHVNVRPQDKQREHDQVPAEPERNVPGPGYASHLLPPWAGVPSVQRSAEAQRWGHPAVSHGNIYRIYPFGAPASISSVICSCISHLTLNLHAVRCSSFVMRCETPPRWSLRCRRLLPSTATTLFASSSWWKEPRTSPAASCTDTSTRSETAWKSCLNLSQWGCLRTFFRDASIVTLLDHNLNLLIKSLLLLLLFYFVCVVIHLLHCARKQFNYLIFYSAQNECAIPDNIFISWYTVVIKPDGLFNDFFLNEWEKVKTEDCSNRMAAGCYNAYTCVVSSCCIWSARQPADDHQIPVNQLPVNVIIIPGTVWWHNGC